MMKELFWMGLGKEVGRVQEALLLDLPSCSVGAPETPLQDQGRPWRKVIQNILVSETSTGILVVGNRGMGHLSQIPSLS